MSTLNEKWAEFDGEQKSKYLRGGIVASVVVVVLFFYYASGQDEKRAAPPKETLDIINVGEGRLDDDIRSNIEKEREENRNQNNKQDKLIKQFTDDQKKLADQVAALKAEKDLYAQLSKALEENGTLSGWDRGNNNKAPSNSKTTSLSISPLTIGTGNQAMPQRAAPAPTAMIAQEPIIEYVGGISSWANSPMAAKRVKKRPDMTREGMTDGERNRKHAEGEIIRKGPKFFLPVGFMKARLLTGLKAKTVTSARNNPEPMLLRVQAPAVLPNSVRAQLQGCLVVAHGYGSLASERIEARLVSISCLDAKGNAMIEAEITGIIADKDGVKGIAARPVSKMGANLARLVAVGILEGTAESLEASAETVSVSALGSTSRVDPSKTGQAGLSRGLANASSELKKIYADLVRQSAPVLETGPGKDVTVVITKGSFLEIKKYAQDS